MSHLTGWQGERTGVWEHNLPGKPEASALWAAHQARPFLRDLLQMRFCPLISLSQLQEAWGLAGCPRLMGFPCELCKTGEPSAPCFSQKKREEPNEASTQQTQSEHKGVVLSPVCELWKSFFHGKFWILIICVGSGRRQVFSLERNPPVLISSKTLHLWFNPTLNHKEMEDGILFVYVSLYACTTSYLSLHFPWRLRAVNKPSTTEKYSSWSGLSSKLKIPQAWAS